MRTFAGTFHRNGRGDWVKCMTEGGKPCSRHAGGEHISGRSLEEALSNNDHTTVMGMSVQPDIMQRIPRQWGITQVAACAFHDYDDSWARQRRIISASEAQWVALSEDEQQAITDYTGSSFKSMTRRIVHGRGAASRIDERIRVLHHALRSCAASEDIYAYRRWIPWIGVDQRSDEERMFYDAVSRGDDGMVKRNFTSTSLSSNYVSDNGCVDGSNETSYVIKVRKGTPGLYVGGHSPYGNESEMLLDGGMGFHIVGIYERGILVHDGDHERWSGGAPVIALETCHHGKHDRFNV